MGGVVKTGTNGPREQGTEKQETERPGGGGGVERRGGGKNRDQGNRGTRKQGSKGTRVDRGP
jgi:hypothetical protein